MSQSLVNEGRFPLVGSKSLHDITGDLSQSLVNEGRFPHFGTGIGMVVSKENGSQSLVNEGRFPLSRSFKFYNSHYNFVAIPR